MNIANWNPDVLRCVLIVTLIILAGVVLMVRATRKSEPEAVLASNPMQEPHDTPPP